MSAVSLTLAVNVDNLTLIGTANGTGNVLNNTIKGNNAVNTLNGLAGNYVLQGLGGNDTYVVDNTSDKTIEAADAGIDSVNSAVIAFARRQCRQPRLLIGTTASTAPATHWTTR